MHLLLRLLASLVLCACSLPPAFAQAENSLPDYVVSWQGDTIRCRMITAAEAKKMPLVRRERFWTQVFFAWDSSGRLRTYRPGDLKAFHRKKSTSRKFFWAPGLHESYVMPLISSSWSRIQEERPVGPDSAWAYLRQVVRGNYMGLYTYSEWDGDFHWFGYYAIKTGDSLRRAHAFEKKSELEPYVADAPNTTTLLRTLNWRKKERYKNLIALFIHYNFERAGRLHNLPERYKKILGIP